MNKVYKSRSTIPMFEVDRSTPRRIAYLDRKQYMDAVEHLYGEGVTEFKAVKQEGTFRDDRGIVNREVIWTFIYSEQYVGKN